MGKLAQRFIKLDTTSDGVNIAIVPDAADGSRVALTNAAQTVAGEKTFSTVPKVTGTPSDDTHVVSKAFMTAAINAALTGLAWQAPVSELCIDADTLTPAAGMRILVLDPALEGAIPAAGDAFEGQANKIAVRNPGNTEWAFTDPVAGMALLNVADSTQYTYTTAWIILGTTADIPDATTSTKGKVQVGEGLAVTAGVISLKRRQVTEVFTPTDGVEYVEVANTIITALKEETIMVVAGAPGCVYGVDFTVINDGSSLLKRISWADLGMDGLITSSDSVAVTYWTDA